LLDALQAELPDSEPLWLFGYGSLIWKPEIDHVEERVATARGWFSGLGLEVSELRLRTRTEAGRAATVAAAEGASFVYLAGGISPKGAAGFLQRPKRS